MKRNLLLLLLLMALVCVGLGQKRQPQSWTSLVEAEQAFARTSVEKGIRDSFLMFFADDGIYFNPHPVKTREDILKRPAPAARPPVELNWRPVYADVSRAGDLGYTTGPYTYTDKSPEKKPTRYGFYFSIWKRQPDESWKVVVDCGIHTPDHSSQKFELIAAETLARGLWPKRDLDAGRAVLLDLDRRFLQTVRSEGLTNGFLKYLSPESRIHRDGEFPVLGREAIKAYLAKQTSEFTWAPIKSDVADSEDLGYTYGSYEKKSPQANATEKGYYVRVWKRDTKENWKLVLDTVSPIPPDNK